MFGRVRQGHLLCKTLTYVAVTVEGKSTLVLLGDGQMDGNLNSYVTPCYIKKEGKDE